MIFLLFFLSAPLRVSCAGETALPLLEREISGFPGYGTFQNIYAVSVDELGDALLVVGGAPTAVHVFDLNTGAALLRAELPISTKVKTYAVWRCGGPIVVMYHDTDGPHYKALGDDGRIMDGFKLPESVPALTNRAACTAGGALFAMSEERAEAALIDRNGKLIYRVTGRTKDKNKRNRLRSMAATAMGEMYALDSVAGVVAMYDRRGTARGSVAPGADEYGRTPANPELLAADTFGNLMIYDRATLSIYFYDSYGAYKNAFTNTGPNGFQFVEPAWMYLTRWNRLVLWDQGTDSIKIFKINE